MYEYRAATIADAPALQQLISQTEVFDSVPRVLALEELIEELSGNDVDLERNSLLAMTAGEVVGVAYLFHLRSEVIEQRCLIAGMVAPDHRDRGVGRTLAQFGVDRATAILRAIDDDLPKFIRMNAYDHMTGVHRLAARFGLEPVRYFDDLLRPLTDLPVRRAVTGVRIVAWPEGRDEEILRMRNTAFLDHWGSVPMAAANWHDQLHGFGSRRDLSFIAVDSATGEVVAALVSARYAADDAILGRSDGIIQTLGTLRAWRGRGVGSALIIEALHAFRDAGLTHAMIGVDSENPSGAARLYRGLGFDPYLRAIAHQVAL